jgi:hypothetical protein
MNEEIKIKRQEDGTYTLKFPFENTPKTHLIVRKKTLKEALDYMSGYFKAVERNA